MKDADLAFLWKCHASSGAVLRGETPSAEDLAALGQLLDHLEPVVKRLEREQAPANGKGRFFRFPL